MRPFTITGEQVIIGMPPGVGDLHWIMTKMESFKNKNNIDRIKIVMNLANRTKGDVQDYSVEYLGLVPFIESAESIQDILHFKFALHGGTGTTLFKNRSGCDYLIEFNSRLENHVKLKDILPEYEVNYDYPLYEPPEAKKFAKTFKNDIGGKLVIIFTSSIAANANWTKSLWIPTDWMQLVQKIYNKTKRRLLLVGAKWDEDYAEKLLELDTKNMIHSIVSKTSLSQLLALLREADVVVTFICGIGIMATQFRTPVACFWPIKNRKNPEGKFNRGFMRTWLPPWAEEVGYKPFAFGDNDATPDGVFDAIRSYL